MNLIEKQENILYFTHIKYFFFVFINYMSNYNKLNHLYKTLLNRNIKESEFRENNHFNFKIINSIIIQSEEYRLFLESIKKAIIKELSNRLNLNVENIIVNPHLEYYLINQYRILLYDNNKIDENYNDIIDEIKKYVDSFITPFELIDERVEIEKKCYLILLENNLNQLEMEYKILNSNCIDKLLGK